MCVHVLQGTCMSRGITRRARVTLNPAGCEPGRPSGASREEIGLDLAG